MAVPKLKAELRDKAGTGDAKQQRRKGMIPAVVYGQGEETRKVLVPVKEMMKIFSDHGDNTMVILDLGGDKVQAYVKEAQRNPVNSDLLHVDFQHLVAGKPVSIRIPIYIHGQEALKKDEILIRQRLKNLDVRCLPQDIMESIDLEAATIEMHKPVTVAELDLPEGIEPLHEPDENVAVAYSSRYVEVEEDEAEESEVVEPVFDTGSDDEE